MMKRLPVHSQTNFYVIFPTFLKYTTLLLQFLYQPTLLNSTGTGAHIAGRLNPDLNPEGQTKPSNLYSKCGGAKTLFPGRTWSLGVMQCEPRDQS
jgi:hypothetical protein